ncbi:unnamed protein product [Prunus armeniaca]
MSEIKESMSVLKSSLAKKDSELNSSVAALYVAKRSTSVLNARMLTYPKVVTNFWPSLTPITRLFNDPSMRGND